MILEAHNISKTFGQNGLSPVNISVSDGQFICVTGESGCGKTTLLNVLSGMLRPNSGHVKIDGKNIYENMSEHERTLLRNGTVGYMAQGNSLIPELTVWHNITCPLELYNKKYDKKQILELTEKLGIDNVLDSYPSDISGGEYRRALLSRVIMSDAKLLLVDEPTSNLDEKSAHMVREILYEEYKKGKGLLIVTHDRDILEYKPEVIKIGAGGDRI